MEKARKKPEDLPAWSNPNVHVWRTKTGNLTVINLRDSGEAVTKAPAAPQSTVPVQQQAKTKPKVEQKVGSTGGPSIPLPKSNQTLAQKLKAASEVKVEEKDRPATENADKFKTAPQRMSPQPSSAAVRPSGGTSPTPAAQSVSSDPVFPVLNSSSTANQFEYISGINIPGMSQPAPATTAATATTTGGASVAKLEDAQGSSLALFHDPIWGEADGPVTFHTTEPKKTSTPVSAATTASASAVGFGVYGGVKSPGIPAAEPPMVMAAMPTMQPPMTMPSMSPAPAQLVAAHPQAAIHPASYPMYGYQVPYVAQPVYAQPQFVTYAALGHYPLGAQGMPTQISAAALSQAAAPTRAGTNVEAIPFVPGAPGSGEEH